MPSRTENRGVMWRRWSSFASGVVLCAAVDAQPVSPFDTDRVGVGEFARLPAYCPDSQGWAGRPTVPSDRQLHWQSLMGETFWHVHHYCYGMLKALRAETMDLSPQVRRALLVSAITEVEYVLRRAPPEFVLLPELYLRVGDYQRKLGLVVDAIGSYERSRAVKPDYWPPYVEQAKLNLSIGRRDAAIQVLEAGLALMPQESRLVEELRAARTAPEKPSRSTNRP